VDDEDGETDYYDPMQLNLQVRDRHVWSPFEVQAAAQLLFQRLAKVHGGGVVDGGASSDSACQAGGLGSIPGPRQTYV
jgi:hypothetical protein